jgi:hypothetical protein
LSRGEHTSALMAILKAVRKEPALVSRTVLGKLINQFQAIRDDPSVEATWMLAQKEDHMLQPIAPHVCLHSSLFVSCLSPILRNKRIVHSRPFVDILQLQYAAALVALGRASEIPNVTQLLLDRNCLSTHYWTRVVRALCFLLSDGAAAARFIVDVVRLHGSEKDVYAWVEELYRVLAEAKEPSSEQTEREARAILGDALGKDLWEKVRADEIERAEAERIEITTAAQKKQKKRERERKRR